jgi:hypothetical protein
LIYAAINTRDQSLLNIYLDKKLARPVMRISQSEYLKPDSREIDEVVFLQRLKLLAKNGDFQSIQKEIDALFSDS